LIKFEDPSMKLSLILATLLNAIKYE